MKYSRKQQERVIKFLQDLFRHPAQEASEPGVHRINRHHRKKGPGRRHDRGGYQDGWRLPGTPRPTGAKLARMAADTRVSKCNP